MPTGTKMKTSSTQAVTEPMRFAGPIADPAEYGYVATQCGRVNISRMSAEALEKFRPINATLLERRALKANGRPVATANDVVEWVFQNIELD